MDDNYEINFDDEWNDDAVLWHFNEEVSDETEDEDCEIWGFSLLEDDEAAQYLCENENGCTLDDVSNTNKREKTNAYY